MLQNGMTIGSAKAERVDGCSADAILTERPLCQRSWDFYMSKIDFGIRILEMHLRWDQASFKALYSLYDTSESGARFKMADITFHRPYNKLLCGVGFPEYSFYSRKL